MEINKMFEAKCYGITGFQLFSKEKNLNLSSLKYNPNFEEYQMGYSEQNPNIICMKYGKDQEYLFHKNKAYELFCAIMGQEEVNANGLTKEIFYNYCKKNGLLNVLNECLQGQGFVLLTNTSELDNTPKTAISSLDKNGEIKAKNLTEVFSDNVSYEELYNYKSENEACR